MKAPSDLNDSYIADIIKQICNGAIFRHCIDQNVDDKRLVMIGEKIILDTGLFAQQ
jgi:hypothetical protein